MIYHLFLRIVYVCRIRNVNTVMYSIMYDIWKISIMISPTLCLLFGILYCIDFYHRILNINAFPSRRLEQYFVLCRVSILTYVQTVTDYRVMYFVWHDMIVLIRDMTIQGDNVKLFPTRPNPTVRSILQLYHTIHIFGFLWIELHIHKWWLIYYNDMHRY